MYFVVVTHEVGGEKAVIDSRRECFSVIASFLLGMELENPWYDTDSHEILYSTYSTCWGPTVTGSITASTVEYNSDARKGNHKFE